MIVLDWFPVLSLTKLFITMQFLIKSYNPEFEARVLNALGARWRTNQDPISEPSQHLKESIKYWCVDFYYRDDIKVTFKTTNYTPETDSRAVLDIIEFMTWVCFSCIMHVDYVSSRLDRDLALGSELSLYNILGYENL